MAELRNGKHNRRWPVLFGMLIFFAPAVARAQTQLPAVTVRDLGGKEFDISQLTNSGRPIVMVFFNTSCAACASELNTIAETYDDLASETGAKVVVIAVDDERNYAKVEPYVRGKEWPYAVYLDTEQRLKNALKITSEPTTLILDGDLNIVWQTSGFQRGDEETIFEKVREIASN